MSRQHDPIPLTGSGNDQVSIRICRADAYMMSRAMLIAANACMMGGDEMAERRLRFYQQQFLELAPPVSQMLRHQTDLSGIAIHMSMNPTWSIHRILEWEWSKEGPVVITCGDATWTCKDHQDAEGVERIAEMLGEVAHIDCRREIVPDVIDERRRRR